METISRRHPGILVLTAIMLVSWPPQAVAGTTREDGAFLGVRPYTFPGYADAYGYTRLDGSQDAIQKYWTEDEYKRAIADEQFEFQKLLYASDGGSQERLADRDTVQQILDLRQDEAILCPDEVNAEECTPIGEVVLNQIFPPPAYMSSVFIVHSKATVGEIERTVESVIDITQPSAPLLLSWRLR